MDKWVVIIGGAIVFVAALEMASRVWGKTRLGRALAERRLQRTLRNAATRPIDPLERDRQAGTLSIHEDTLSYSYSGSEIWSTSIADCRLVGERTTAYGPYANDWFLVVFVGDSALQHEAPVYANPEIHRLLSKGLGDGLRPQLTTSTTLHSAIVWPLELEGRPLFDYEPAPRGRDPISRLKDWLSPIVTERLSEDACKLLRVKNDSTA